MSEFRLNLYPSSRGEEIKVSGKRVLEEGRAFANDVRARYETSGSDPQAWTREELMAQGLEYVTSWGILSLVDGVPTEKYNILTGKRTPDKSEEARAWARERFSDSELQRMLDISVNSALLVPINGSAPGYYQGHRILYGQFIGRESMFSGIVTPEFRIMLLNGRFWESLAGCFNTISHGYPDLTDCLDNHFEDLDPDFAEKGMQLFKRASHNNTDISLYFLPDKTLKKFGDFVEQIHSKGKPAEIVEALTIPYIEEVVGYVNGESGSESRFKTEKPEFREMFLRNFAVEYLTSSEKTRASLAKALAGQCYERDYGYSHIKGVLDHTPGKQDIGDRIVGILSKISKHRILNFKEQILEAGADAREYLGLSGRAKLLEAEAIQRIEARKKRKRL